ncbi:hypothetical protein BAE44_0002160 [Dichanthelium oligosanthes]|uniref:Transmembrane protein n=1 Tax=Dichanthelium oligosanthes TaxID=888268 RepID=A0A1E5WI57_9POAL|nr:hypothetical protein BAE44_0002160 [Dichanthelium oligosanthes]
MQSRRRLEARRKRVERRNSMGSLPSGPPKPGGGEAPAAAANALQQLRRSVGSQGSTSVNAATEQGIQRTHHTLIALFLMFCYHGFVATALFIVPSMSLF